MALSCPRCDESVLVDRRVSPTGGGAAADVYVCERCKGVWLDGTTLTSICPTLAHLPEHRDEIALMGAAGAGIPRCLRCGVAPYEYEVLGVAIDFCLRCSGVWLDGDEYEESMLTGTEVAPVETRGGPYRRAASTLASGEVKCAYCGASTDPQRTYVRERGPACAVCHFGQEQRSADIRATDAGAESSMAHLLEDVLVGVRDLLVGHRR